MDGSLVIIRLAPADYHRYHFPLAEMYHLTPRLTVIIIQLTHLFLCKMTRNIPASTKGNTRHYKPCV
jgi:hypothetical protein